MTVCLKLDAQSLQIAVQLFLDKYGIVGKVIKTEVGEEFDDFDVEVELSEPSTITLTSETKPVVKPKNGRPFSVAGGITYKGKTKPVADWAREKDILATTIVNRLRLGWTVEEALETPVTVRGANR